MFHMSISMTTATIFINETKEMISMKHKIYFNEMRLIPAA